MSIKANIKAYIKKNIKVTTDSEWLNSVIKDGIDTFPMPCTYIKLCKRAASRFDQLVLKTCGYSGSSIQCTINYPVINISEQDRYIDDYSTIINLKVYDLPIYRIYQSLPYPPIDPLIMKIRESYQTKFEVATLLPSFCSKKTSVKHNIPFIGRRLYIYKDQFVITSVNDSQNDINIYLYSEYDMGPVEYKEELYKIIGYQDHRKSFSTGLLLPLLNEHMNLYLRHTYTCFGDDKTVDKIANKRTEKSKTMETHKSQCICM